MNSSVTLSSADKVSAALKNTNGSMNQSAKTGYSDLKDQVANNDFLGKLLPAYTTITNDTSVEYRLSQVDGMSGDDLSQNVANKTKNGASYPVNFTVTAYDTANKNVVGTKKTSQLTSQELQLIQLKKLILPLIQPQQKLVTIHTTLT